MCACKHVHMCTDAHRGQQGTGSQSWSYRQLWAPECEWSERNSGPLEEQNKLLTAEPSFQPEGLVLVSQRGRLGWKDWRTLKCRPRFFFFFFFFLSCCKHYCRWHSTIYLATESSTHFARPISVVRVPRISSLTRCSGLPKAGAIVFFHLYSSPELRVLLYVLTAIGRIQPFDLRTKVLVFLKFH